jgi:hypothetical protein
VLDLDTVALRWQLALDADERALDAAAPVLATAELAQLRGELVDERREAKKGLGRLAVATGVRPEPWLSLVAISSQMLGLPGTVTACLFDLDGVLTDSGVVHASAWAAALDGLLQRVAERDGRHFIPFDREGDYLDYIDGRPRLEGVHAFLDSRGIPPSRGPAW